MAEERFIDDDKDRKYKIRINENGEEELVIDETEEAEEEIPVFAVPEFDSDDEDAAVLSPEQYAEKLRRKEEDDKRRAEKKREYIEKAESLLAEKDFEGAKYNICLAGDLDGKDGTVYALKLKILTRNFTEFNSLDECAQTAEGVKNYSSAEQKKELKELSSRLLEKIEEIKAEKEKLSAENDVKKSERRVVYKKTRNLRLAVFLAAALPLMASVILTVVFATLIHTDLSGKYIDLTVAFGVVSGVLFIASLILAHRLWAAQRNVNLNESDRYTKIGREIIEKTNELELLLKIGGSFDDDIS